MVPITMTGPIARGRDPGAPARLDLRRADIGFSAAHFSVIDGKPERLHGHNYRVALRAWGRVGAEGTMVDFGALKDALRAECGELDERTLLPGQSATVAVHADREIVEARQGDRRYVFPRDDVRILPVPNTTCECLAAHLLARTRARLADLPVRLEVTVEELPGQSATMSE
jgi:6-pyruvoyltetrahydropterin/6-carboxytetrahydropterin synthase